MEALLPQSIFTFTTLNLNHTIFDRIRVITLQLNELFRSNLVMNLPIAQSDHSLAMKLQLLDLKLKGPVSTKKKDNQKGINRLSCLDIILPA